MSVYGAGSTDKGLCRGNNEDSLFISNEAVYGLSGLYIVADGIGGSQAGEIASTSAIRFFCDFLRERGGEPDGAELLYAFQDGVQFANRSVYGMSLGEPSYEGMGTTFVAATVKNGMLFYAHIGDSRLYRFRGGELSQVTTDHTFGEQMLLTGMLTKEQAEAHDHRNMIMRWIGTKELVEPELGSFILGAGELAMLCTDGLSNMLSNDEISGILALDHSLDEKVQLLIDKANGNGGKDNITVILIERRGGK